MLCCTPVKTNALNTCPEEGEQGFNEKAKLLLRKEFLRQTPQLPSCTKATGAEVVSGSWHIVPAAQ